MSLDGAPRFLVVRRDNIGDLVCTTPLIAALRSRHPNAYIAALTNSYNRAVLFGNPDLDQVFSYVKLKHRAPGEGMVSALTGRFHLLSGLRKARIDCAILATPAYQPRLVRLVRWAGATKIAGFVPQAGESNHGIDLKLLGADGADLHEVEDVFRLAQHFGIEGAAPPARIFPDLVRVLEIKNRLAALAPSGGPTIALHISARKVSQRWPADNFTELAKQLRSRHSARIVLLWAPGDASNASHPGDDGKARTIAANLCDIPMVAIPTEELADLIAIVSQCDLMICADGGAMHIAAALGKPIVCLFGNSNPTRWHPWGTRYELLQSARREVTDIGVSEVAAAAGRLLGAP